MVIIVESGADKQTVDNLIDKVRSLGFTPHPIFGVEKTVIAVVGHKTQEKIEVLETMPGVQPAPDLGARVLHPLFDN